MKNSLFRRLFWSFIGAIAATVLVLALIMVTLVRAERRAALENEIRVQARDLAKLIQQNFTEMAVDAFLPFGTPYYFFRDSGTLDETISWKISEIQSAYDAQVSRISQYAVVKAGMFPAAADDAAVLEQIARLSQGNEIRVTGVFNASGNVLTIGVPYADTRGAVVGAVLLHVSTSATEADYTDVIRYAAVGGIAALLLGALLAYQVASRQTKPLREIQQAVNAFSSGDFEKIPVRGNDEMAKLAESFNRMAEDLNRLEDSRRTFVANVSHELRSPMTSIRGYVQGILDGTIGQDEQNRYLDVVLSETQRLTKLVNELLELSRFDSGKSSVNPQRFDITALILKVMFEYEQRIEARGIDVDIEFREQPLYVLADPDRITQVLNNLIDNAVKFSDDSGLITVRAQIQNEKCAVIISNTGPGISREDLPMIFERFYKADKAHTAGMGTGLGLAIVKKIVDQHGEAVSASSVIGDTSFTFTLKRTDG